MTAELYGKSIVRIFTARLSSKVAAPFAFPPGMSEHSCYFIFSSAIGAVIFVDFCPPIRCVGNDPHFKIVDYET